MYVEYFGDKEISKEKVIGIEKVKKMVNLQV